MNGCFAVLESTKAVIACETLCERAGLKCSVVPMPREISAECGVALAVAPEDRETIARLCASAGLSPRFFLPYTP